MQPERDKSVIAFGPKLPGIGSWEWIGAEMMQELSKFYDIQSYTSESVPDCDVLVVIKHDVQTEELLRAAEKTAVIFCPVDRYGSCAEIDAHGWMLARCAKILVHCQRLCKYFRSYAPVELVDHHLRFVTDEPPSYRQDSYVFWAGIKSHLPILAEWVNAHRLPAELRILTNVESAKPRIDAGQFGFDTSVNQVRIERWSQQRHLELVAAARLAIDIKGNDFRQRHKPAAKAIDFIASGLPLATNPESYSAEYLSRLGFEVVTPLDTDRWLSQAYFDETQAFGATLRESLSLQRIGLRYKQIIDDLLSEQTKAVTTSCSPESTFGKHGHVTETATSPKFAFTTQCPSK
jgi:hypothetical protein